MRIYQWLVIPVIFICVMTAISCGYDRNAIITRHNEAIASMSGIVPYYEDVTEKFPSVVAIRKFPNVNGLTSVQTIFLVKERYECTIYQDILYSKRKNKVTEYKGNIKLSVNELRKSQIEDGRRRFSYSKQWKFGEDDIKKLEKSNWDLSILGIDLKKPPVENSELLIESWNHAWGY